MKRKQRGRLSAVTFNGGGQKSGRTTRIKLTGLPQATSRLELVFVVRTGPF